MSKRIAFVGTGALGGYVGGWLAHTGQDVTLIDMWPENVEAIRARGLELDGLSDAERITVKSARTMHLSTWQTIWTVLIPATLPEVVAGLRIGFTVTLLGVLLAEMFASKQGLGFLIMNAMSLLQSEEMITVAVVLFVFAVLANALLLWMEHRLHRRV